jgi:hypothetical protein
MFRAQFCAVLGSGLMLAAASAEAGEVLLSVDSRIGGDSNVFRTSDDRRQDGFIAFSPQLSVHELNRELNYSFGYRPTYETYFETSDIDGFDHKAHGNLTWRATPVDRITFGSDYTNNRRVRYEDGSSPSDPVVNLEGNARERVRRANAQLSYSRELNSVLSVSAAATFGDTDFSRSESVDSRGYTARVGINYVLTPLTVVGLSGSLRRRDSDPGSAFQVSQQTQIWNISVSVERELTPTLTVSAQAGPSFIRSNEDIPIAGVPNRKNNSTSYFANFTVAKSWQRSHFNASYSRSESAGSDTQAASILDSVTVSFDHKPTKKWILRVSGSWLQSKEIEATTRGGRQEVILYSTFASATRTINSHFSIIGQYSFYIQDEDQNNGSGSVGPVQTGFLALRYTFDPLVF